MTNDTSDNSLVTNEDTKDATKGTDFQRLKARIVSFRRLKNEFYALKIDEDQKIDEYIKLFREFNDEFLDAVGELGVAIGNVTSMSTSEINDFVDLAKSFIGHSYVWGAEGEISDKNGICFDCSGLVDYLMKTLGLMPKNAARLVVSTIPTCGYFYEVPWDSRKAGDILTKSDLSHVVIYEGNDMIVHASNSAPYPKGGVKEGKLYFKGRCFRIKGYGVE